MKKFSAMIMSVLLMFTLFACTEPEETPKDEPVQTCSIYTDLPVFQNIPAMEGENIRVRDAADYGNRDYLLVLQGMMKPAYDSYLKTLEAQGFTKVADNGPTGVGKSIVAATFVKDTLTVNVSFMPYLSRTYIYAAENKLVSPRLVNDPSFVAENKEDASTILTMQQLEKGGNSYILQLKNGHFIICDGGDQGAYSALLTFLKERTPEGEKPYVEGWFISHAHGDHMGFFQDVNVMNATEIIVEGFYYNEVSSDVQKAIGTNTMIPVARDGMAYFVDAEGKTTPVYRSHAGDRYYFSDINIEVLHTNEQIMTSEYEGNYNASCTWLLFNIEGQKFLNAADTEIVNMRIVAETMDREYMDMDIMNVHHHGGNLYLDDVDYYRCETLLYAAIDTYSIYWVPKETTQAAALELQDNYCDEYVCYVRGSVVLTFPYEVGTYEVLPSLYPEQMQHYIDRHDQWMRELGRS